MVAWYFRGGALDLSRGLAIVGLTLLLLALAYGIRRSAFTLPTQRVLAVGGALVLDALLNGALWVAATDPDNAYYGARPGTLVALGALLVAVPVVLIGWVSRRGVRVRSPATRDRMDAAG